jgi:hypothetical protein
MQVYIIVIVEHELYNVHETTQVIDAGNTTWHSAMFICVCVYHFWFRKELRFHSECLVLLRALA